MIQDHYAMSVNPCSKKRKLLDCEHGVKKKIDWFINFVSPLYTFAAGVKHTALTGLLVRELVHTEKTDLISTRLLRTQRHYCL